MVQQHTNNANVNQHTNNFMHTQTNNTYASDASLLFKCQQISPRHPTQFPVTIPLDGSAEIGATNNQSPEVVNGTNL